MNEITTFSREIHHYRKKKFQRRKVIVGQSDETWSIDIGDVQAYEKDNDGYKYILCVVDVFSKYAFCEPLKNKSAKSVLDALKKIVQTSGRSPQHIWSDKGKEFYNKEFQDWCKTNKITLYSTYGESKSVVAERFIRTLKTNIELYATSVGSRKWIDVLSKIVKKYNNTKHRTIKMTPTEASKPENEIPVFTNLTKGSEKNSSQKAKFHVNDQVRISRVKDTFEKGYTNNWSYEVFTIDEVLDTNPVTYKLKDYHGDPIEGSFYSDELLKTTVPDYFLVDKILKRRTRKGVNEVLVKFVGWPSPKFDEWLDEASITNI